MKQCAGKCQQIKSLSEFSSNAGTKDGKQKQCRVCYAEYQKSWYQRNRETHRTKVAVHRLSYRKRNRKFVNDYLTEHPCVDCGIFDIRVLEFDHITDDKIDDVSRLVADGCSLNKLRTEIEKCKVRCANCHRIKTCERRIALVA